MGKRLGGLAGDQEALRVRASANEERRGASSTYSIAWGVPGVAPDV
jgi:hypothetical protein